MSNSDFSYDVNGGMARDRNVCVMLTTAPDDAVAARLARAFVERGLAACVSRLAGVKSVYRWQGEMEEDSEIQLLIKTRHERIEALRAVLVELHPYDEPECLVLDAGGSRDFLGWIVEETAGGVA